jgi:hypothetical protein
MAKAQVTEDDLKASVGGLGGFSGLTGKATRRDSPFGSDYVKRSPNTEQISSVVELPATQQQEPERSPADQKLTVTSSEASIVAPQQTDAAIKDVEPKADLPEVSAIPVTLPANDEVPARIIKEAPPKKPAVTKVAIAKPIAAPLVVDDYTERMTLPMTFEMRERLDSLARQLQRRRADKSERITANTLIRVAIEVYLDALVPGDDETPSNEGELRSIGLSKVKRRG